MCNPADSAAPPTNNPTPEQDAAHTAANNLTPDQKTAKENVNAALAGLASSTGFWYFCSEPLKIVLKWLGMDFLLPIISHDGHAFGLFVGYFIATFVFTLNKWPTTKLPWKLPLLFFVVYYVGSIHPAKKLDGSVNVDVPRHAFVYLICPVRMNWNEKRMAPMFILRVADNSTCMLEASWSNPLANDQAVDSNDHDRLRATLRGCIDRGATTMGVRTIDMYPNWIDYIWNSGDTRSPRNFFTGIVYMTVNMQRYFLYTYTGFVTGWFAAELYRAVILSTEKTTPTCAKLATSLWVWWGSTSFLIRIEFYWMTCFAVQTAFTWAWTCFEIWQTPDVNTRVQWYSNEGAEASMALHLWMADPWIPFLVVCIIWEVKPCMQSPANHTKMFESLCWMLTGLCWMLTGLWIRLWNTLVGLVETLRFASLKGPYDIEDDVVGDYDGDARYREVCTSYDW